MMKHPVHIDRTHARAIAQEIAERLQDHLKDEPETPVSLRGQIERLHKLDSQSSTRRRGFGF